MARTKQTARSADRDAFRRRCALRGINYENGLPLPKAKLGVPLEQLMAAEEAHRQFIVFLEGLKRRALDKYQAEPLYGRVEDDIIAGIIQGFDNIIATIGDPVCRCAQCHEGFEPTIERERFHLVYQKLGLDVETVRNREATWEAERLKNEAVCCHCTHSKPCIACYRALDVEAEHALIRSNITRGLGPSVEEWDAQYDRNEAICFKCQNGLSPHERIQLRLERKKAV